MQTRCHKPRNMGNVHHHQRPYLIADGTDGGKVDDARIRGSARNDHLGLAFQGNTAHFLVVDGFRFRIHAVGHKLKVFAAHIHGAAVG